METFYALNAIVQSMAVSLGVGGSTIAILNFFVAIRDGQIDTSERRLMGVVYVVLRVAMVVILVTTFVQAAMVLTTVPTLYWSGVSLGAWTAIGMLYLNAVLMTKHIMPSTFGPAIQAASWYTLGLLLALVSVRWNEFTYGQFLLGYIALVVLFVAVVNTVMALAKRPKSPVA